MLIKELEQYAIRWLLKVLEQDVDRQNAFEVLGSEVEWIRRNISQKIKNNCSVCSSLYSVLRLV